MPIQNPRLGNINLAPYSNVTGLVVVAGSEVNGSLISFDSLTGAYSFQITDTNLFFQFLVDVYDSGVLIPGSHIETDQQQDPNLIAVCESPIVPQAIHEGDILIPFILEMPDGIKVIEKNTGAFGFVKDQKGQIEVSAIVDGQEIVLQVDTARCKAKSCVYKAVKCITDSDSCCGKKKTACNISVSDIKLAKIVAGKTKIESLAVSSNGLVSLKLNEGVFVSKFQDLPEFDATKTTTLTIRSKNDPACKTQVLIVPFAQEPAIAPPPTPSLSGMTAKFWNYIQSDPNNITTGPDFDFDSLPTYQQLVINPNINEIGATYPAATIANEKSVIEYNGFLRTDVSGFVNLIANVDDGIKIYIDDAIVLNSWLYGTGNSVDRVSSSIPIVAGQFKKIKIQVYNRDGYCGNTLSWRLNGLPKITIPNENYKY